MLGNGFDARLKTVCDCLHEAVGASDPARALETAALLLSAGVDVNAQVCSPCTCARIQTLQPPPLWLCSVNRTAGLLCMSLVGRVDPHWSICY